MVLRILDEAERFGAAGMGGEIFQPFQHPPDRRDIQVEMARSVADHRVKLAAGACVWREIAADADSAVAMRHPGLPAFRIVADRPAVRMPHHRRIAVREAERANVEPCEPAFIFRRWRLDDAGGKRLVAFVEAPLDDVIFLDAVDA